MDNKKLALLGLIAMLAALCLYKVLSTNKEEIVDPFDQQPPVQNEQNNPSNEPKNPDLPDEPNRQPPPEDYDWLNGKELPNAPPIPQRP